MATTFSFGLLLLLLPSWMNYPNVLGQAPFKIGQTSSNIKIIPDVSL